MEKENVQKAEGGETGCWLRRDTAWYGNEQERELQYNCSSKEEKRTDGKKKTAVRGHIEVQSEETDLETPLYACGPDKQLAEKREKLNCAEWQTGGIINQNRKNANMQPPNIQVWKKKICCLDSQNKNASSKPKGKEEKIPSKKPTGTKEISSTLQAFQAIPTFLFSVIRNHVEAIGLQK